MIPREYVTFYKSLKNIKYMLHCALLYHEISKMKTNILHKMYRILWHNSDERVFYLSWKYDMKGMKKNGTEKENFWSIR